MRRLARTLTTNPRNVFPGNPNPVFNAGLVAASSPCTGLDRVPGAVRRNPNLHGQQGGLRAGLERRDRAQEFLESSRSSSQDQFLPAGALDVHGRGQVDDARVGGPFTGAGAGNRHIRRVS